jgi:hypothetical protein
MKRNHDIVDVPCTIKHETDLAVLINDGDKDYWLPFSQVEVDRTANVVSMPEWLAIEKGLI